MMSSTFDSFVRMKYNIQTYQQLNISTDTQYPAIKQCSIDNMIVHEISYLVYSKFAQIFIAYELGTVKMFTDQSQT
jgi:hypothetical protein